MSRDPESSSFLEPSDSSVEEDILEEEGKDVEVFFGEKIKSYEDEALADIEVDMKTAEGSKKLSFMTLLQQCSRPETKEKLQ